MTANSEATLFECANCEATFMWLPLVHHGLSFCCPGCAVGGPCSCSYDDHPRRPAVQGQRFEEITALPMTAEAWRAMCARATQLALEVAEARERRRRDFGQPAAAGPQPVRTWEVERAEARLEVLRRDIERAEIVEPGEAAVVGSRVTLRLLDDGLEVFALVPPGDEDATLNHVSPDSPLGQTLLWTRVGDLVTLPVGERQQRCTVVSIAFPDRAVVPVETTAVA